MVSTGRSSCTKEHAPLTPVGAVEPNIVEYVAVPVPALQSHQECGIVKPLVADAKLQVTGVGVIACDGKSQVVYLQS